MILSGDTMYVIPESLLQILFVSMVFSVVLMALIQKLKTFSLIKKKWQIWILNLIFSFVLGVPFGMMFYHFNIEESIWVGIFSFIGASTIYDKLEAYSPVSFSEVNGQIEKKEKESEKTL